MKDIHEEIDELCLFLKQDENRKELEKLNEQIENDEEVIKLASSFQQAQREYASSLDHYEEDSEEVKNAQHQLYIEKKKLDEHPLVEHYYYYLSLVNEPLRYLEYKLFNQITKPFKNSNCIKKEADREN